jgi:RimJ/RimL family protein N-acetyltransferase
VTDTTPVITLAGENVAIGPLRRDLIPTYQRWISNLETTQFTSERGSAPTLDEEAAWYESVIKASDARTFTIYALPDFQPIGTVNLHQINHKHRKANMGIMIGEPEMRGRGLGTEAVELILDYGFHALSLNSIWLATYEFNIAGRRAYARAGFTEVGRRRQCRFHAGRFWDEIHMDILSSEFTRSRLEVRMIPVTELERRSREADGPQNRSHGEDLEHEGNSHPEPQSM